MAGIGIACNICKLRETLNSQLLKSQVINHQLCSKKFKSGYIGALRYVTPSSSVIGQLLCRTVTWAITGGRSDWHVLMIFWYFSLVLNIVVVLIFNMT